ncbi:MAG: outer membrane lipoprotein-sorting protein [Myxococcota bacterium]
MNLVFAGRRAAIVGSAAMLLCLFGAGPGSTESAGLTEVEACMRGNTPVKTGTQEFDIGTFDGDGEIRSIGGTLWWRRFDGGLSKLSAKLDEPPDMRGSAFLLVEKPNRRDMFSYLPELRKTRRITSRSVSGSLFGTEFSYEDFEHLRSLGSTSARERLPDEEKAGRKMYVISSQPAKDSGSAYTRIVSRIDQETCVPVEVDFFALGEDPVKQLRVSIDSLTRAGEVWIPKQTTIRNLQNQRESRLSVDKVEFDVELPKALFSQSRLNRL